ncbi:MAG: HAD family hydrolase [Verrucomicrobiota bacterium]|nr:HAD family hydrolase [Verrucomicrobiota bacterium]
MSISTGVRFSGAIELAPGFVPRQKISHVLFDFDGTLSLVREGWPDLMLEMFLERLPPLSGDSPEELRKLLFSDMMELNGKPTIFQMERFARRVAERGAVPLAVTEYLADFSGRLLKKIKARTDGMENGSIPASRFLLHGAREFLELLRERGFQLWLASGTDEISVKREAALLGVTEFFGSHIYGAQADPTAFSKKHVIDRLLRENGITGEQLVAFGDGHVEIQNTKEVGGLTVAVASDEANNGSGRIDPWKRARLLDVGADIVIPDFRDGEALLSLISGAA